MASREGDFLADLECGGTTTEEEGSNDSGSGSSIEKKTLSRARSGSLSYNGLVSSESDSGSSDSFSKFSGDASRSVELLIERNSGGEECRDLVALLEKRNPSDQPKKPSLKKTSKPPRPPKGPLLNAADLKLMREISELAARKRARIERMKALRKMKEAKRPSSSTSLTAMLITILFFFVIILQGVFTRNKFDRENQESPAPVASSDGLISIQLFNNAPASEMNGHTSLPLNSLVQASGSSPNEEEGRDTG